jgi:hypothetical protein
MDDSQNAALVEAYLRESNAFLEWNEARGFTDPLVGLSAPPKWGADDHVRTTQKMRLQRQILSEETGNLNR